MIISGDEFRNDFHILANCQALSLNLSLSLRDGDRADTIITLYHTTPPLKKTY